MTTKVTANDGARTLLQKHPGLELFIQSEATCGVFLFSSYG